MVSSEKVFLQCDVTSGGTAPDGPRMSPETMYKPAKLFVCEIRPPGTMDTIAGGAD